MEYSLTALGESLWEPFERLYDRTVDHTGETQARQPDHDRRAET